MMIKSVFVEHTERLQRKNEAKRWVAFSTMYFFLILFTIIVCRFNVAVKCATITPG